MPIPLHTFDTVVADPSLLIHRLVERAAEVNQDRTAVAFGDHRITYHQLNERADALAQVIGHHAPDADLIGVSASRSIEMVIGVLAILKAGKAYLPLDPTYPAHRLQQLISDSGVAVCLSTETDLLVFESLGLTVIRSDADHMHPHLPVGKQNPTACVLYTSGSTGKPKGVCLGHEGLINLLNWQLTHSEAKTGLNTLQFCHLSFDASFQELFVTLLSGGTLHLIDDTDRLDAGRLLQFIDATPIHRVFLPYVVLQYVAETADVQQQYPAQLREVITGGELLKITPQIARFFAALPTCTLVNVYGPTEASVWVTENKFRGDALNWPAIPTIGKPIAGIAVFMLDETGQPAPDGTVGELCISGPCLANGYLNQPQLTAEKFIRYQHPERGFVDLYRTGDLARCLPDGSIEFLGRKDNQVKIRGNRVELGEIEVVLAQQPGVQQAVVTARETGVGSGKTLIAYVIASAETEMIALRSAIARQLPDFMIPAYFVRLDEFPRTSSGKVDRSALPAPERKRPDGMPYRKARTTLEKVVTELWSSLLQYDQVGVDDNFFELGGNSLLAQKTVADLSRQHHTLPITKLYQYPTAAGIAWYMDPSVSLQRVDTQPKFAQPARSTNGDADVAVIGMAGRFPGASTIGELWDVLKQGKETIRFFTPDELAPAIPERIKNDPLYVPARGVIDGADQFDAQFFGLPPKLAELMDPQQRIFLEIAWETLEQTGYLPQHFDGRVGVFAGCGNNTYYLNNVLSNPSLVDQIGAFQVMTVNEKDYIASRTAYQLNLTGPAVSVYSACSTSLLAIAQAVQSLRSGQCEVALAGGASITAPVNSGHLYQEGAMLSRDGHCRSFDADAQGTVFSDGAGVVLLKNAEAARRDGDTTYAVIKGVGVNNDGGGKGSFTAPNADGQAGAIRMAIADAGVDPATISYVETHGTATPVGDPIEIEGLVSAFGEQTGRQYCAIGSVKSNMGHLTQAAGVAGFIKTTLALYHRQIPASLGFTTPNPNIDFANSPFFVNTQLADWKSSDVNPRRAGVSSFGVGGTNVHVMLEESCSNPVPAAETLIPRRPMQLLTWSAKSTAGLDGYAHRLADALTQPNGLELADVAFTLQTTRAQFSHRRFVVADCARALTDALCRTADDVPATQHPPDEVVFLFPGQGAQYLNMGRTVYEREAVFRQAVDDCADYLIPHLGADIRHIIYPNVVDSDAEQWLKNTRYTQPALFVTEYALARLWMSWGIAPTVLCGHSIGEFVAAHLAGVFSLSDALTLIATRGRMVGELPRGSMLSVRMDADVVQTVLPTSLSMAAVNGRSLCVVAGADEEIADFARLLDEKEIPNQLLVTSHAFHSAMMDSIVDEFETVVAGMSLSRPQLPIVSTVTGRYMTDAEATDPRYWARHLRATVRFADALDTIFEQANPLLLDVGPGNVMATLARQQAGSRPATVLTSLLKHEGLTADYASLLKTLGQLWQAGLTPDWTAFYAGQQRRIINLPTYAFDRKRCWVDPILPGFASDGSTWQTVSTTDYFSPEITLPTEPIVESPLSTPVIMRKTILFDKVKAILDDASGIDMEGVTPDMSFLEIGLDSLLLTQVAITLKREFGLPITFRQLTGDYATPGQLTDYLDQNLPADAYQPAPIAAPVSVPAASAPVLLAATAPAFIPAPVMMVGADGDSALSLIAQQLQLLARQIALLQGVPAAPAAAPAPATPAAPMSQPTVAKTVPAVSVSALPARPDLSPDEEAELKKPFGATARIERQASGLSDKQRDFLQRLTGRYNQKTAGSKAYAQENRSHMADPRVVSGFRPLTKEIVYPLVINRSKGSRLWDIDGNEYIDVLNGFGSNLFGYQPDLIKKALHEQVENGFEVGPQHELAGEVSRLVCELTGSDRAALCSTGSEAVLGTMRLARTVTGRSLIVAFSGSYHGIIDEVIVRGTKKLKSFPAAPGIMPESVQNMLILDYGTDESLRIIRERAHELAAVLVEPVQSRRPEFVPIDFLKDVRAITAESGTALIFDEIITGFRMHPGGMQHVFSIKADLASYGKVVGAGLPIGVIAGKREFMDALDGGFWQYGDASVPEVGVTYFAGTFVRHPLALAAACASLQYIKDAGPALQQGLTQRTKRLADAMNAVADDRQLPFRIVHYGSLWKIKFSQEMPYGELLFTLMREKGVHVWDGFPCFMTEAHTDAEMDTVLKRFVDSVGEMTDAGFFTAKSIDVLPVPRKVAVGPIFAVSTPPVSNARLGRDRAGNPAWFAPNPARPGNYLQVELT